ncbi:hypothetical protein [Pseudomonas sp. BC115LW]|uniref:hypothetical protein n=1 Tax=Pseudomonas sp. BC115LW TaxID=2683267 RepID=UPI0014123037|nr:hypothetical protein [Pseudomonas sp. BC115LW]NBB33762.1 hypothetical protein [Pseudomonas sp. BC115LW]
MTTKKYSRLELASNQLEAAIGLFVSGGDRFSVITLAGAADVILSRLILNKGKENFTDAILKTEKVQKTREELGREVNDMFFINQLKHMDPGDDGYIDLEPEDCAIGAILKALANYVTLVEQRKSFVDVFLVWVRLNLDPNIYNVNCDPNWAPLRQGK